MVNKLENDLLCRVKPDHISNKNSQKCFSRLKVSGLCRPNFIGADGFSFGADSMPNYFREEMLHSVILVMVVYLLHRWDMSINILKMEPDVAEALAGVLALLN